MKAGKKSEIRVHLQKPVVGSPPPSSVGREAKEGRQEKRKRYIGLWGKKEKMGAHGAEKRKKKQSMEMPAGRTAKYICLSSKG